eukprot:1747645-Pyramimonas_sp.AAC.1
MATHTRGAREVAGRRSVVASGAAALSAQPPPPRRLQAAQSALAALGAKLEAAEKSHAEILAQKDEARERKAR